MKKLLAGKKTFIMACCIAGLAACNNAADNDDVENDSLEAGMDTTAQMGNAVAVLSGTVADTTVSGFARFRNESNGQVTLILELSVPKMANNSVAVHLHEHGDCGDKGNNAHGHWNPTNENHGKWGEGQYHSGDIGNIDLDGEGNGVYELTTDRWTIGGDSTKNIIGRAVIVHSGKDDYTTQPTGNAGGRIGCGVIQQNN